MKSKFKVRLVGMMHVYCDVPVLAETFEEAQERALELAQEGSVRWEESTGNMIDDVTACDEDGDT